ncbi:tonsoku-like protein [Anoplophora glabripennis]|uniref:tonsoku-like protein n=1 Tax=Anoplophora glabripennis TaxID=217634 RepID=UPI000874F5B5|nr:tonsoku-like protein [Anoplophora glabripennis]
MMEEQKLLKRKRKAKNEGNETLLVSACTDLAELYIKEGRYNLAIEEYEVIADIYKKQNKLIEYAQANRAIGEAYMGLNNYEKALEHQRLYLNVANEENNKLEQQRALATMGHIYLSWYLETQTDPEVKLNAAYKYFMKSLMIAESLTGINKLERVDMMARLFSNLGLVKECLGDYSKALELLNRSIGICKQHDIYEQLYRGYISIASLYEKRGEYNDAIRHYNLAIDSAKKLKGNTNLICAALLVKSEALVKLADFHGAKQVLLKAYKLKTPNIKEKQTIERNLRTVALMCRTEDELVSAGGNEKERKILYEKMGDNACDLKIFAKAIEYYKLMLECAEKSGVSGRDLASCYYSLAETYKDNGQFSEAVAYFEREYALCTDLKDSLNTLSNIADTKEAGGAPIGEVKEVYERAFAECRRCTNLREEKRMILRCIAYLRRNNNHTETFELNRYLDDHLEGVSLEDDSSSSDNESEDSEIKRCTGDDINLDNITDDSEDSDIENRQSTSKEGMAVGKRKNRSFVVKKNAKGESQLHVACINGSTPVVHHLVEQGHPVNIRDNSGWLPLHEACNHGYVEIARFLLDKGAAINDRGGTHCNGITPLYDAANNGHLKVVELLLDRGASAVAKTDDGDTPLSILQEWQSQNPLHGGDLVLYRSLVKRMSEAMEKAGQSTKTLVSGQAPTSQRNDVVRERQRERRSQLMDTDESPEYDEGGSCSSETSSFDATSEYIKVMGTLRNKTSNVNISPATRQRLVSKRSALVVAENDILDDWLEDDLQASKVTKRRKTGTVASLIVPAVRAVGSRTGNAQKKSPSPAKKRLSSEYEIPETFSDDDFNNIITIDDRPSPVRDTRRSSNDSRSSTEGPSGVKRKNQASLLDSGFSRIRSDSAGASFKRASSFEKRNKSQQPKITLFGHRSFVEADSTTPVSSQTQATATVDQTQSLPPATGDLMVFVDVKVEGRMFRVPVLLSQVQTNTIGWLSEQAANKYARKECSRPTLELETTTGALLSDEDPLSLLFPLGAMQAEPVVGRVVKLSLPPLVDRYKEASLQTDTEIEAVLCHILEEVSVNLNLSNKGILGESLVPLCRALSHQTALLELDLSGNFLDTDCMTKLCSTLPTLVNLTALNLRCTGLVSAHLAELVKVFTSVTEPVLPKLSSLDLSDNFLRDRSLQHLARMTAHLKLTTLNLSNVRFTEDLFRDFDEESCRLNLSDVRYLDISDNGVTVEDVRKFLWWTTKSKLLGLNVSRNSRADESLLGALVDSFQDDICGVELKSLNLSRSDVQETELYSFLRLCSRSSLLDIDLSYNANLTGVSLRRLLEHSSLRNINLIGCDNILRYFDDCGGCDLLEGSDANGEKLLKISTDLQSFPGQVATLIEMFKSKYSSLYVEKTDNFLLLSSKALVSR